MRAVVVDPEEVDRRGDQLQVTILDQRLRRPQIGTQVDGVSAAEHRIEVGAVVLGIERQRGRQRGLVERMEGLRVHCRSDDRVRQPRPERLERVSVPQQDVVNRGGRKLGVAVAWGVGSREVALLHGLQRLVDRDPHRRLIAERLGEYLRELA